MSQIVGGGGRADLKGGLEAPEENQGLVLGKEEVHSCEASQDCLKATEPPPLSDF